MFSYGEEAHERSDAAFLATFLAFLYSFFSSFALIFTFFLIFLISFFVFSASFSYLSCLALSPSLSARVPFPSASSLSASATTVLPFGTFLLSSFCVGFFFASALYSSFSSLALSSAFSASCCSSSTFGTGGAGAWSPVWSSAVCCNDGSGRMLAADTTTARATHTTEAPMLASLLDFVSQSNGGRDVQLEP